MLPYEDSRHAIVAPNLSRILLTAPSRVLIGLDKGVCLLGKASAHSVRHLCPSGKFSLTLSIVEIHNDAIPDSGGTLHGERSGSETSGAGTPTRLTAFRRASKKLPICKHGQNGFAHMAVNRSRAKTS